MNDFSDWLQNNGVDLARLFVQIAILAGVVFYSRKILSALRASQQQLGALLRMSLSDGMTHPHQADASDHSFSEDFAPKSTPAAAPASEFSPAPAFSTPRPAPSYSHSSILGPINGSGERASSEREQSLGGRIMGDRAAATMLEEPPAAAASDMPSPTPWVSAPLNSAADSEGRVAAAVRWLQQAPAPKRKGVNPLKKMVRWLQSPAGS
jgi:hypothetical protein